MTAYDPAAIARSLLAADLEVMEHAADRDIAEAAVAAGVPCPDPEVLDATWQRIYDAIDALLARVRLGAGIPAPEEES